MLKKRGKKDIIKREDMKKMARMIEMFEENDDVQNIYHNWENEDLPMVSSLRRWQSVLCF